MRIAVALLCIPAFAQLTPVPNTDFPTFRTNLNNSIANGASITGSYTNPSWIVSIPASKVTGLNILSPSVLVTSAPYNALCNNTGNDQVAFDAAYTALTALGGGTITAPSGVTCRITTIITAKSNVKLVGSFTINQATASAFSINFSGTQNAGIDGVTLNNGGIVGSTSGTTSGLRISNTTVQTIASSTFPSNVGFYSTATLTNTRISGSQFINMQSAMYMSGTVSGFALSQNTFTTISVNDGIQFPTGGTYSGLQLIDNKGIGFAAQGIEIQGTLGDQALIRGNNFSGVTGFGISNGAVGAGIIADGNVLAGIGSYGIELGANSTATNNKVSGFGQGITVNGGPNDTISINTISNVGNCIYASNSGTSDNIKVLGNVCNEPTSNGIVMIDGSGSGGVISGNTVNRTPITGDGSSTVVCYFGGSAATARTWSNNTCNWLSGTHGASANYWGVLLTADVAGSRYDGFRINNASGSATNMLGINCNSFSTELNGTAVTGNQFTNLTTGISCPTSSTMQYALNYLNPGTTPLGFGMVGSNVSGAQKFFGTAAPGSVAGNLPGDLFSDTTNHNEYWCNAVAATVQPACTTVAVGGWTKLNGTGGGGTIPSTTSALKGDGAGNAAAVTGTGTDCVLVNGGSGTCGTGYTSDGTILIAGSVIGVQTAVIPSKVNLQAGTSLFVTTTSSSNATYTGTMSPTLTAYTAGQLLVWNVGSTACTSGAKTLNVDALGAKSLFLADGSTALATGDCTAGRILILAYDGTAFRLIAGGV